jgi:hypothetical protein
VTKISSGGNTDLVQVGTKTYSSGGNKDIQFQWGKDTVQVDTKI